MPPLRPLIFSAHDYCSRLTRAKTSLSFHTVVFGPSLNGFGYLPDLIPFHHDVFEIGIIAGIGGSAVGLPII